MTLDLTPHRERIKALLKAPGMNRIILADRAQVHRNTLNGVDSEEWNPKVQTFFKIMRAVEQLERPGT